MTTTMNGFRLDKTSLLVFTESLAVFIEHATQQGKHITRTVSEICPQAMPQYPCIIQRKQAMDIFIFRGVG